MEDYAKAQSTVTKGLSQNPGNRALTQLEQKIKAKGK
jgi:hypothetical protein